MKLERLVGVRFKEKPAESVIDSHALMVRGGYIKQVANGIYSSYHLLNRITKKVEQIIREEMDSIDGQEVLFPVVMPASLWQESGRYESIGSELMRITDRNETPMLLGMTHEEAAVHLVKEYGQTYTKYPFMVYQIQTKFRDEARPRGGLIRVREFTMKDGYSFHTSYDDLASYYERCYHAYEKIFARVGIPEVVSVSSDSGMMGGKVADEFMLLTPIGEDSVVICNSCGKKSNLESTASVIINKRDSIAAPLKKTYTPNMKTIEEVCGFLDSDILKSCKAVIYQRRSNYQYVVVFIRGDLEVNEAKLRNHLSEDIFPATVEDSSILTVGFIGPVGLNNIQVLYDSSLERNSNLICGANEKDYHYTGLNIERDCGEITYYDLSKAVTGGVCEACGEAALSIKRGIEVGNIFQLGDRYTKSMGMTYTDAQGRLQYPIMGCYGIGIGRLIASVCEAKHDEYGPIWPMSIAPYQLHLCCLNAADDSIRETANRLYHLFCESGYEVIYDDRHISAGVMFSDADLLGIPIRIVISNRNLKNGCCEISLRDRSKSMIVSIEDAPTVISTLVEQLRKQ